MKPKRGDWIEMEETIKVRKKRLFLWFTENGNILTVHPAHYAGESEEEARKEFEKCKWIIKFPYEYEKETHKIV